MRYQKSIFWLRRDLRLDDNVALSAATSFSEEVVLVFVFDTNILDRLKDKNDRRINFIHHTLRELDQKLRKKGSALVVFHGDPKKEIPEFPMHIGVVTSPSGAVIQDIKNVLARRAPLVRLTLAPSLVQGNKAENEIINALSILQEFNKTEKLDLIIIARGGGSLEDLWCFNSEKIARKIYALEIPVVSAVGHETDFTICDLVSDLRAPTPSAAAEIASQAHSQIVHKIEILEKAVSISAKNYLETKNENFKNASNELKKINFNLDQKIFKVDESFNKIVFLQKERFSSKRLKLLKKRTSLRDKNPLIKLSNQKADLKSKKLIFINAFNNLLSNKKISFDNFSSKLEAFSPLSVLSRGYTVSTKDDELLDNIELTKGDEILTRTERNLISSKITKIDEIK